MTGKLIVYTEVMTLGTCFLRKFDTLRLRQNVHFINKFIFFNENWCILISILLKFAIKCPMNNNPVLVQIMAWHRTGAKPSSESEMPLSTDAYMHHSGLNELI